MAGNLPGIQPFEKGMDFSRWMKRVDFYTAALDITDDGRKRAVLLHLVGAEVQDVYDTLPEPQVAGTATEYEKCVAKLKQYCSQLVT